MLKFQKDLKILLMRMKHKNRIILKNCPNCKERIGIHDIECPYCKYIDDPKYKKQNEKILNNNKTKKKKVSPKNNKTKSKKMQK